MAGSKRTRFWAPPTIIYGTIMVGLVLLLVVGGVVTHQTYVAVFGLVAGAVFGTMFAMDHLRLLPEQLVEHHGTRAVRATRIDRDKIADIDITRVPWLILDIPTRGVVITLADGSRHILESQLFFTDAAANRRADVIRTWATHAK